MRKKTKHQNLWEAANAGPRRKFIAINAYIREEKVSNQANQTQIKQKEENNKVQKSMKSRMKKQQRKLVKPNWKKKKPNKTDKPIGQGQQTLSIKNQIENILGLVVHI